ncbi:MAG: DUF309 domain-containing protein [Pseudomonadota bacterium]|jgi:hypothetical protein
MLLDLNHRQFAPAEAPDWGHFLWEELAALWNANDLAAAHDWLNERWSRLVRNRPGGQADPEARFLQALAFAVLALYFTQTGNQEGARLMLDDALVALARYRPRFLGLEVEPIVATLLELQPVIAGLAPDAECPLYPFVFRKLEYDRRLTP